MEGEEAPLSGAGQRDNREALGLLEESQGLLRAILLGIGLQYRSLDIIRCQLQGENPPGPGPEAIQQAATLVTLCALFGFQEQAERVACQAAQSGAEPDMMNVKLGAVSILVALLRLAHLRATAQKAALPESAGESLDAVETLAEPPAG